MKKIMMFAACAIILASCAEEDIKQTVQPEPGTEIKFALQLDGSKQTRTIYGDETDFGEGNNAYKAFPIYWVNKDQIIVASPQCASGRNNAIYEVTPGQDAHTASDVTKVGDGAGVQWGSTAPADCNFYSVYPVSYYPAPDEQPVKNSIEINGANATAKLNVRQYQRNLFTQVGSVWKGTPIDSRSLDPKTADLNMKNPDALMFAQTKGVNAKGEVELIYKPFTVAFNITLDGYTLNTDLGTSVTGVTIQEVTIEAPAGTKLVGNFDATFSADHGPVVTTNDKTKDANIIHVPTLTTVDGAYLQIKTGESVNFNVFAIPTDQTVTSDWKLTVRTPNGTYSRSLTPGNGANAGKLVAGQMHKLKLPTFQINQQVTLPPATWMQRIPRNVYLSELSLPGAWYAGSIDDNGNPDYQSTANFGQLWSAGVRAFAVETRTCSTVPLGSTHWTPKSVVVSGTGSNTSFGTNAYREKTDGSTVHISTVMSNIIAQLKSNPQEYAVLVLSYADGGSGGHRAEDYAFWLQGLYEEYNSLSAEDKLYVCTTVITPNTTVNDVLGKLIIKVNCGSGLGDNHTGAITKGSYGNNIPGLLSYTDQAWDANKLNSSLVSQMHWSTWDNSYMTNAAVTIDPSAGTVTGLAGNTLYWNYTLANRTQKDDGTNTTLPKYENRKKSIETILANSRTMYLSGKNGIWYFIGAGGTQASQASGGSTDPKAFASNMNQFILEQLNTKLTNKDFSPFGIVMCNFITGNTYHGTDIIAKILQMNTEFRLNRDETQPEWPGTQTQNATKTDFASWVYTNPLSVF